jgi:hypothetical protein
MRESLLKSPGGLPPRLTPEAYVRAEVASFPLVDKSAFQEGIIELAPAIDEDPRMQRLWHACEKGMSKHGWSLDRLLAIRDYFWFWDRGLRRQAKRPVPLHRYLRNLAKVHLEREYGVTEIAHHEATNTFDAFAHYRWLSFALPDDLLLVATGVDPPPTRVDIEPPLVVRRLLDRGVAEVHHHIGAGMDFQLLWVSTLAILADPALHEDILESPDLPFDGSEQTVSWLLAAVVARAVLAEFLHRRDDDLQARFLDFLGELGGEAKDGPRRASGPPKARHSVWRPQLRRTLEKALRALRCGDDGELPSFGDLRDLYQEIHPTASKLVLDPPRTLAGVWRQCDPIAIRLGLTRPNAGEQWLMLHALRRLEEQERTGSLDEPFARLFWQVLRLRCMTYRTVVQRPMTAGLQWFIRFYNRLAKLRPALERVRAEVSFRVAAFNQPIAALEVRTGAPQSPFDLAEGLSNLLGSWRHVLKETGRASRGQEPEFGTVLDFIKQRDMGRQWERGNPPAYAVGMHSDPEPGNKLQPGGRYSFYYSQQSEVAQAIVDLLQRVPRALWLVRGIDVASDELSVPTWVLVPLYNYVETWSARVAVTCAGRTAPPPLRLTAHVGEDFRHLMEGLRRVFECVRYLLTRPGGRLGHATALGYEPRLWAESVGSVMMPAEERLWDLAFEWRLYSQYSVSAEMRAMAPPGRTQNIENQMRELSDRVFGWPYDPHELAEAHHVLHQLWCRPMSLQDEEMGLGQDVFVRALSRLHPEQVRSFSKVRRILRKFREDEAVYQRGQELVDITLDESEVDALYAVQEALRRSVGAHGIVVEVNPSSNLLIGNLLDLRNHPLLRLFPPQPEPDAPPPIHIAVGSDDPITFGTYLMREYSLLYEAALSAGYGERVVEDWLASIRQTSMDARFTVPWEPTAIEMADRIRRELDDYLQRPRRVGRRPGRSRRARGQEAR